MNTTQEAIAQTDRNADPDWKERALEAVVEVAGKMETFTADDVWEGGLDHPREGRALGGVMVRAKREGICAPTNQYTFSRDPKHHHAPNRVWRSLLT